MVPWWTKRLLPLAVRLCHCDDSPLPPVWARGCFWWANTVRLAACGSV